MGRCRRPPRLVLGARPRAGRPADRDRHRDPAPPALRRRPRHQPHARLRRADGDARRHLPRLRAAPPDRAGAADGGLRPGHRRLHAGRRRSVSPRPGAHPARGRPPLLPSPLRRGADAGGVLDAPARPGRPRRGRARAAERGGGDGAPGRGVAVAAGARMSWERAGRLAWIAPVLAAVAVALRPVVRSHGLDGVELLFTTGFVIYAGVGALIAARRPRNAVGWLFCAIGVIYAAADTLDAYTADLSRPGAVSLAVFQSSAGATNLVLPVIALLLFPTGRYLSPRWRRAGTAALALSVAWTVFTLLDPGPLRSQSHIRNPLGVNAATGLLHRLTSLTGVVVAALLVLAAAGIVERVRRARGLERQQLKWLGLSVLFAAGVLALLFGLRPFVDLD